MAAVTPAAVAEMIAWLSAAPVYDNVRFAAAAGEFNAVFKGAPDVRIAVAPEVSLSVSVMGFSNGSLPTIAAPLASLKVTVSGVVAATPTGGLEFASAKAI